MRKRFHLLKLSFCVSFQPSVTLPLSHQLNNIQHNDIELNNDQHIDTQHENVKHKEIGQYNVLCNDILYNDI